MATNKDPIFFNTVISKSVEFDNAASTTAEDIFSASTDGGAVTNLSATTTDSADVIVVLRMNDGVTVNVLGEVKVPAGSGTNGTASSVNLLDADALPGVLQNDGSLIVGANSILTVAPKAAVTAATVLSVTCTGGSYSV